MWHGKCICLFLLKPRDKKADTSATTSLTREAYARLFERVANDVKRLTSGL